MSRSDKIADIASITGFVLCLAGAGMGIVAFYFPAYQEWGWLGIAAALFMLGVCLIMLARHARGDDKFDWGDGPGDLFD